MDESADQITESDRISNGELCLHPLFQYKVDFHHRTVKDFFQVKNIRTFIASRMPETFDSYALPCHALLTQLKVAPSEVHHFNVAGELSHLVDDMVPPCP